MEWFIKALRQFSDFEGRARRKEYWMFRLFWILLGLVVLMIDGQVRRNVSDWGFYFTLSYVLVMVVPLIAVSVRRLHDTGKSGWFYLLGFVPLGDVVLLVFFCTESTYGENEYGPNPKGIGNRDEIANLGVQ